MCIRQKKRIKKHLLDDPYQPKTVLTIVPPSQLATYMQSNVVTNIVYGVQHKKIIIFIQP